jgi:Mrp family chromosome partitioning ATPase
MVRVLAPATPNSVKSNLRGFKITLVSIFGGFFGLGGSLGLILIAELLDCRIRTVDDVKRITKLPVLGTLDNLSEMEPEARSRWAFRTWIMLQGRLSRSANHGLVCGITSSTDGEGRSTWINLLAEAASLAGFRVLTIATRPSPTHIASTDETFDEALLEDADQIASQDRAVALADNVLSSPAKVAEQFTGSKSRPVVHIPLPGWVWNLERRKQWRDALNHWKQIDNLVILVELPPASVAEAVLLGSNLPNLVWLSESGKAEAAETRAQLETLRDARCNLAGAVLNREPAMPIRLRFQRWLE